MSRNLSNKSNSKDIEIERHLSTMIAENSQKNSRHLLIESQELKAQNNTTRQNAARQSISESMNLSKSKESHLSLASNCLDRVTRRIIAPYAQIERKELKEGKEEKYIDIEKFKVFLKDEVDLNSLLYETSIVVKNITKSSGVFLYLVDKAKNEIVLMPHFMQYSERHEVNEKICQNKTVAGHVAATKEYIMLSDVSSDTQFSKPLNWCGAHTVLCMPVVEPDGEVYAVLELYRHGQPYDNMALYSVLSCAGWAGAAIHQTRQRITMERTAHLNHQLLLLVQQYFCDLVSIDTMISEVLSIAKQSMGALRSTFYMIEKDTISHDSFAQVWDDEWLLGQNGITKKKLKVNLSEENSVAGQVLKSGESMNVVDVYRDPRFTREVDPVTGAIIRSILCYPIRDKYKVIGIIQAVNKKEEKHFTKSDEDVFEVLVRYCALMVHFARIKFENEFAANLNKVYDELSGLHLKPCIHDFTELVESIVIAPSNFISYEFYANDMGQTDMAGLICHMLSESVGHERLGGQEFVGFQDFVLSVLQCYQQTPYHNAQHAFLFTHTMFVVLSTNEGYFNFIEIAGLMLGGFCHDIDHPGFNNNYLALCRHPLADMYNTSTLENHHFMMAKKLIENKGILEKISKEERDRILEEMRHNIMCTDLANYFRNRAALTPLVVNQEFHFADDFHRSLLKVDLLDEILCVYFNEFLDGLKTQLDPVGGAALGILMTSCDLSGMCKPFLFVKKLTENIYEEFYNQGDLERELGYTPLISMDRKRSAEQPSEQIQFLSIVVLPCFLLLQSVFPNTSKLSENCRVSVSSWQEELATRGCTLWTQADSLPAVSGTHS